MSEGEGAPERAKHAIDDTAAIAAGLRRVEAERLREIGGGPVIQSGVVRTNKQTFEELKKYWAENASHSGPLTVPQPVPPGPICPYCYNTGLERQDNGLMIACHVCSESARA